MHILSSPDSAAGSVVWNSLGICRHVVPQSSSPDKCHGTRNSTMGGSMLYICSPSSLALSLLSKLTRPQGDASTATTIALNVFTTSLIAGRVWWYKRNVQRAFGEREFHLVFEASSEGFNEYFNGLQSRFVQVPGIQITTIT